MGCFEDPQNIPFSRLVKNLSWFIILSFQLHHQQLQELKKSLSTCKRWVSESPQSVCLSTLYQKPLCNYVRCQRIQLIKIKAHWSRLIVGTRSVSVQSSDQMVCFRVFLLILELFLYIGYTIFISVLFNNNFIEMLY